MGRHARGLSIQMALALARNTPMALAVRHRSTQMALALVLATQMDPEVQASPMDLVALRPIPPMALAVLHRSTQTVLALVLSIPMGPEVPKAPKALTMDQSIATAVLQVSVGLRLDVPLHRINVHRIAMFHLHHPLHLLRRIMDASTMNVRTVEHCSAVLNYLRKHV